MDDEPNLTNSLQEAISLLRTIHKGQQDDRGILHEQRSTLQNAVQAQSANFAYHESVVQENADLKKRISEIIAEKAELEEKVIETLAEKSEMAKKHSKAVAEKLQLEKRLAEALARNAQLERKDVDAAIEKVKVEKRLSDSLAENTRLEERLHARDSRERDTQAALSQLLRSFEGNKELTAKSGVEVNSGSQHKRRMSATSHDELASGDTTQPLTKRPRVRKQSCQDDEVVVQAAGLSDVVDLLHFWRPAEGTRHPYAELRGTVKAALKPHLDFYTTSRAYDSFSRGVRKDIKCTLMRAKCKGEPKPEGMYACRFSLDQSVPCILVEQGFPPTLVPLPAHLREGKHETDPAYWIPGYDGSF